MSEKDAPFSSRDLRKRLQTYPAACKYLVGFSGGADSTALLAALHQQRAHIAAHIEAIHFNHGLQSESGSWQRHCERFCAERGIPLTCHALEMTTSTANLEGRARALRYRFIADHIDDETLYLTAHNADDRAETFLINALRGSGLEGLASIPELRELGRGYVARPLLTYARSALVAYLRRQEIEWLEDPSNEDTAMDRNFLRHEVLPLLETRWPAARRTLARTAGHAATASAVLDQMLTRDAKLGDYDELCLPLRLVQGPNEGAAGLILRAWLRRQNTPPLPEARLEEFLDQLERAGSESQCETAWAGWTLRQFRQELRLLPPEACPECPRLDWNAAPTLNLGRELGTLQIRGISGDMPAHWIVAARRPGDKIRLRADGPRRKLKKIFQEHEIPPWQRKSIPVLYRDDAAVAIGDWLFAPEFAAWLAARGYEYRWQPGQHELQRTRRRCHDLMARVRPA